MARWRARCSSADRPWPSPADGDERGAEGDGEKARFSADDGAARLPAAAGTVLSALFPILARSLLNCVSVPV